MRGILNKKWRLFFAVTLFYLLLIITGYLINPVRLPITETNFVENLQFSVILYHNLRIIILISAGGLFLLIPTILVFMWNGFLTGVLISQMQKTNWIIILLLHGVPEIIGQICASISAVYLFKWLINKFFRNKKLSFKYILNWFLLSIFFTLLSAIIECKISVKLIHSF